jgi:peptide/nickel transport system ATP-binding protein
VPVDQELLRAEGLTKYFPVGPPWARKHLHAVDKVDFAIYDRQVVALVGESGSGKSTIARLLAMLARPSSGEIYLDGRPLSALRSRADRLQYRRQVQMVFQDPFSVLNPAYRVSHALLRTARLHRPELGGPQREQEVARVLDAVGLSPARNVMARFPYELSGGQQQRVGFAAAMLCRPRLILADEPVSMLDVSIRIGLLNLMADLRDQQHLSVLYITHDIASAWYLADRVIVMYAGQFVEEGPSDVVLRRPRHPYTQLLLSAVPDPRVQLVVREEEVGEPPRVVDPDQGCRFRGRCPFVEDRCHSETPGLAHVAPDQWAACFVAPEAPVDIVPPDRVTTDVGPRSVLREDDV